MTVKDLTILIESMKRQGCITEDSPVHLECNAGPLNEAIWTEKKVTMSHDKGKLMLHIYGQGQGKPTRR